LAAGCSWCGGVADGGDAHEGEWCDSTDISFHMTTPFFSPVDCFYASPALSTRSYFLFIMSLLLVFGFIVSPAYCARRCIVHTKCDTTFQPYAPLGYGGIKAGIIAAIVSAKATTIVATADAAGFHIAAGIGDIAKFDRGTNAKVWIPLIAGAAITQV